MTEIRKLVAQLMRAMNIRPPMRESDIKIITYSIPTPAEQADMEEWMNRFIHVDPKDQREPPP